MPFPNILIALCVGVISAAIVGWVLVKRLLGKPNAAHLSKARKWLVWYVAAAMFCPALLAGYVSAIGMINVVASPGPWLHLTMDIIVALTIGIVGALVTWLAALIGVFLLKARYGGTQRG